MAKCIPVAAGRRLLGRLKRAIYGRRHSDFLLLLRLENQALLTKRIRSEGLALTQAHLTMRISRVIGHNVRLQIISPGNFAVLFPSQSSSSAMMIAEKAQEQMQERMTVADQSFSPVMTGVLMQLAEVGTTQIARTVEQAREYLDSLPPVSLGKIVTINDSRSKTVRLTPSPANRTDLIVHFHPQLCCETGRVLGFEAIPDIANESRSQIPHVRTPQGLSRRDWLNLIRQALDALTLWQNEGWNVPVVALAMTDRELEDGGLTETLLREIRQRQMSPDKLAIGIRTADRLSPAAISSISMLQLAGCRLYLSGFASNRCDLELLQKFNIRRIGIDAAYTLGCNVDQSRQRLLLGILAIAEKLDLAVIAEEVETREEHAYLSQLGCDEVQGRAIARPMLLQDSLVFLASIDNRRSLLADLSPIGNPDMLFCRPSTRSGRLSTRRDQM